MQPEYVVFILAGIILAAIYITPPLIAFKRGHPQRWAILIVSLAFGGTLIGWVAALIWAIQPLDAPEHLAQPAESEGFALQATSVSEELERLHQLLQSGAITRDEYEDLKLKLISAG